MHERTGPRPEHPRRGAEGGRLVPDRLARAQRQPRHPARDASRSASRHRRAGLSPQPGRARSRHQPVEDHRGVVVAKRALWPEHQHPGDRGGRACRRVPSQCHEHRHERLRVDSGRPRLSPGAVDRGAGHPGSAGWRVRGDPGTLDRGPVRDARGHGSGCRSQPVGGPDERSPARRAPPARSRPHAHRAPRRSGRLAGGEGQAGRLSCRARRSGARCDDVDRRRLDGGVGLHAGS